MEKYLKFLPSKKFAYIVGSIIVAFLIVLGVQNLAEITSKNRTDKKSETTLKDDKLQEFLAVDSDKDGLKDWEEGLWKTDPKKADTDEDGTSDGDEVKTNRDPLKKAPGDEIDPKIIAENKKDEEEFAKLNPTEQFSRIFFSQYIDAKNSTGGRTLSTSEKQAILNNMISDLSETSTIIKYRTESLNILNGENTTTIKDYGNKFGLIILENSKYAGRELIYMAKATAYEDEKSLDVLDLIIKEYNNTIASLASLPVPAKAASTHADILNAFENMKMGVEGMKKIFYDPATAIISISQYQASAANLFLRLDDLKIYFDINKVTFQQNEPGILIINFKK